MRPEALADVDVTVLGSPISFTGGVGYQDKNFRLRRFFLVMGSYEFRILLHILVWRHRQQERRASLRLCLQKSVALETSCRNTSVVVRPWGANGTYPPVPETGITQDLVMTFDIGAKCQFYANVTTGAAMYDSTARVRNIGTIKAKW